MAQPKQAFRGKVLAELVSRTLFAVLMVLTVYGAFAYYLSKKTFETEMGNRLSALARMATQSIRPEWVAYLDGKGKLYEEYRGTLERQRELSRAENVFLLDLNGHVLVDARGKYDFREPYWMLQLDPEPFSKCVQGVPSVSGLYQGRDGFVYKVAYESLGVKKGVPSAILGVEASADFVAGLRRFSRILFFLGLVCLGVGGALLFFFGRRLVAPLKDLSMASRRVAVGDFSSRVHVEAVNEMGALAAAFNDMTEQLQAHNDYILESMENGLIVVDLKGNLTTFNQAASRMLRIPPDKALGLPYGEVLGRYPSLAQAVDKSIREKTRVKDVDLTLSDFNPTVVRLQTGPLLGPDGRVLGIEILLADETQLRRLQVQVQEAAKMATIGELSAGIAHEIRNPLGAMKGFTEILLKKVGRNEETKELVQDIATEIEILNKIVTNFLVFARPTHVEPQPHELVDSVRTVLPLIRKDAETRDVTVSLRERRPVTALLDLEQFRRAVLNVCLNAVQASPARGTVELEVGGYTRVELVERLRANGITAPLPNQPTEEFAVIEVSDRGPGLPEDLSKLFTPFFTTKTEGFGLGLSITKRILEAHAGTVGAAPREGGGARFILIVPAAVSDQPKEAVS